MIFIDYHSRTPIYKQIKEQIIMLINTGVYQPDDKLPSIRTLSAEININVNTVKRAFQELEMEGVTYSAQGRGIFVAKNPLANERIKQASLDEIRTVAVSGKAKGVTKEDMLELIEEIFNEG